MTLTLLLACLASCASAPQTRSLLQQSTGRPVSHALIVGIPFHPQEEYQCGPAALATMLGASGIAVQPEELVPLVYVPDLHGSLQIELIAAARSFGRLVYPVAGTLESLLAEVDAGHPVLVLQNLGLSIYPQWHYAVVKGYDLEAQRIILNSGTVENYHVPFQIFERTWNRADNWGFVVLEPGALPATAEADDYFQALVPLLVKAPPATAAKALKAALVHWPDDRNLLMSYGNHLYSSGQLHQASTQFARVIRLDPLYAPAYNNLAHVQTELGLYEAALVNINQALVLGPQHASTYRETHGRLVELMRH